MPALELFVEPFPVANLPADGNLPLDPPLPGLNRVLLRRLYCRLRVPPIPGAMSAIIDTGAPLSIFPHTVWYHQFGWRAGRDYDELTIAGVGGTLQGQVLGHRFGCRLARLRASVELAGRDPKGDRLRIDSLVCQLAEPGGPPYILLGLWGGALTGRKLAIDARPLSDELAAKLGF
jgi:hypothetical protein